MHSNRFSFLFSHKQQLSTLHLCVCSLILCVRTPVCLWPLELFMLRFLDSLCQEFLRQLIWGCETKTGVTISIFTKNTVGEFPHVSVHWLICSRLSEVREGYITVISGAVGSSLMRFHAMMETTEGQCYVALQQEVPQQPVVPLLLYLPSS